MTDVATLVSEGEFCEGSVYSETGKVAGMKSTTEWTVTHFDPPAEQTHVGEDSSMHVELTWTLAEIDSGTRASHVVEFKMMPVFRPLGVLQAPFGEEGSHRRELAVEFVGAAAAASDDRERQ